MGENFAGTKLIYNKIKTSQGGIKSDSLKILLIEKNKISVV
tara:strand:- start:617 stop:739 length:123 start_codon:yes stop_codon:yes gene_type:complete